MNSSMPGLPVHHQLPEPAQTHIHHAGDAIQPSHPLSTLYSCLHSFPAAGSFSMSQHFTSDGQRIGVSASASILPMKIQDWFPLGWTDWIFLQSKRFSRVFSNTTVQKHQYFVPQLSLWFKSHIHTWLLEEPAAFTRWTFAGKVMSLLFSMLPGLVITFLPRCKRLLISWLQSPFNCLKTI